MNATDIASAASGLSFGPTQHFGRLAVVPLTDPSVPASGWLTLDVALANGTAEITEVSDAGRVPELQFLNRGASPVFLLDGEELVGAKQNRILNISILAPADATLQIPVSCVEQGRWSRRSHSFRGAGQVIYSKLRRSNAEAVSQSLFARGSRSGDQGSVWESVASKSARMSVHSETGASSALYESYATRLESLTTELRVLLGQVGAAFFVDDRFVGLDLLGGPDLVPPLLQKLVRSYVLDVLDEERSDGNPSAMAKPRQATIEDTLLRTISEIAQLETNKHPSVGIGTDVRLKGKGLIGSGTISQGRIAHLSLWAADYH